MDKGEWEKSPTEYHYNVPWFVEIEHQNDHLAVFLYCERKSDIPWSVQCAFQVEIVHPSGKTKAREKDDVFDTPQGNGWSFMKWEEMKKEYLNEDQLTVVVNVTINEITGICLQPSLSPPRKFSLKHTFNNVSRMDKGEQKKSPMEYHFNLPWNVVIEHRNDDLAVFLHCYKNSNIPWSVQCAFQVEIVHPSGKTKAREKDDVFDTPQGNGWSFMKWEEMKREYLDGDQLTVVVNVNINQMTGICLQPSLSPPRKFTLKHIFTNVSRMDKGEQKKSPMEYHFNLPWFVEIEHENDDLAVWLHCNRNSSIPWSVQCAYQIEIVHPSGKTKSSEGENVYENAIGYGPEDFMKWEEMKKEYLDRNQLTVVVNVNINQMTGI